MSTQIPKSSKIHISEADQIRLMLHLLTILDGTNERLPDVVRTALRELKAMFVLSDESENEANRQHHERWKGLSQSARSEARLATIFSQLGSEPTKPVAADDSQAQPVAADITPADKLPTAKMRKALACFDDLDDADQVDTLRGMWCDEGEAK